MNPKAKYFMVLLGIIAAVSMFTYLHKTERIPDMSKSLSPKISAFLYNQNSTVDILQQLKTMQDSMRKFESDKKQISDLSQDIVQIKTLLGEKDSKEGPQEMNMTKLTEDLAKIKDLVSAQEKQKDVETDMSKVLLPDSLHHNDDNRTAQELYKKVRVLCYIPIADDTIKTKGIHVYRTWGRHCNRLLFFAEHGLNEADQKELAGMEVIGLEIPNTGNYDLTKKMFAIMQYLYKHYLNDYDWFMKADTDTYVVAENLRYMLSGHQTTEPIYFGHHFKTIVKNGYMSGGGGYVLSREALKRFGEQNGTKCGANSGTEDVEVGKCMQNIGVLPGDSRDKLGRSRFHCLTPNNHVHGGYPDWYKSYDKYGAKQGMDSISDYAITFHFLSMEDLYMLEFYIYHLRPYGIITGLQELNGDTGPVLPD